MRKQKYFGLIAVAIISMMLFVACGSASRDLSATDVQSNSTNIYESANGEMGAVPQTGDGAAMMGTKQPQQAFQDPTRKLIKNVELSIETKEYDKLSEALNSKITEVSGYVQNSEMSGNSYARSGTRRCNIIVRVPKDKLDSFIEDVSGLGNVVRKSERVEDVTLQYVDVESHKKSLKIEQERLIALLEKASVLEDIITLESRLSEVRYQLETYESQLRTFDNLVDYSTVTIDYFEVAKRY